MEQDKMVTRGCDRGDTTGTKIQDTSAHEAPDLRKQEQLQSAPCRRRGSSSLLNIPAGAQQLVASEPVVRRSSVPVVGQGRENKQSPLVGISPGVVIYSGHSRTLMPTET